MFPLTIPTAKNGTPRRWELTSADSPPISITVCASATARQGLVHFGQGKWYPGEQLPRWSLNCFWRADGEPIWRHESLIADESRPGNATEATAATFLSGVAERLGLDARHIFPAYEDALYFLWRERRLPANVDPFDSRLEDTLERERLVRVFSQGLKQVVGYALPVTRDAASGRWRSGSWFLRSEHCYLVPGESPMGYRLPLDSLPWAKATDYPYVHPPDPTAPLPPLASHARIPLSGRRKAVRRPGNFKREPCRERRLGAGRLLRPCAEPLRERVVDQPFGHVRGAEKRDSLYFYAAGGIAGGLP